jgi:hypothetical protein
LIPEIAGMNKQWFGVSAVLALVCTSCSNGLYPVSGKVTHKGQPAAGAAVFFKRPGVDSQNEHLIMGRVQEDGSFTLVYGSQGQGAPPGEYDVLIEWKDLPRRGNGRARTKPDKLKGRYADPAHPRFHASVKAESNHPPPFELTD